MLKMSTWNNSSRYLLPKYFCPPEAWPRVSEERPSVDGERFDVWAAGILMFNSFTESWIESELFEREIWKTDVYPWVLKGFQVSNGF